MNEMEINKSTLGMVVIIAVLSTYFIMAQMDGKDVGDVPLLASDENSSSIQIARARGIIARRFMIGLKDTTPTSSYWIGFAMTLKKTS